MRIEIDKEQIEELAISIADFDNWTIEIIGKDGNVPATTKHYVDYILLYLICGNGLLIKRFASVLMRLFTRSLKPRRYSPQIEVRESSHSAKVVLINFSGNSKVAGWLLI